MAEYLSQRFSGLSQEKEVYFNKILSEEAIFTNFQRTQDTAPLFQSASYANTMYFIWLNISAMYVFGLDPRELEPLDPEFEVKLPSEKEWLQGIKVKVESVPLDETWSKYWQEVYNKVMEPVADYDSVTDSTTNPEYSEDLKERKYYKLVLGQAKYGEAYVDPPVVRDFLRATFFRLHKEHVPLERTKDVLKEVAEQFGISEGAVEALYNRFMLHMSTLYNTFVLGYNLLGVSPLAQHGSEAAVVPGTTWRDEAVEAHVMHFQEVNLGFVLGVSPLGYGLATPKESLYQAPAPEADPYLLAFVDWKVRKQVERYPATPAVFANYQRPEETLSPYKNERLESWAEARGYAEAAAAVADAVAARYGLDGFKRNMVRRAAMQLVGYRKKRHRWGYVAFERMTEEEFKEWWVTHWANQGLDKNLLYEVYNRLSVCLGNLRLRARLAGERVRRRRYALATQAP